MRAIAFGISRASSRVANALPIAELYYIYDSVLAQRTNFLTRLDAEWN